MWPKEYIELKHIEDLLVCGICYEFMDTSVMTSCSHNYCSLCIRKYLHYKTQCPACFSQTFEKDLRKNKVIDEIIASFLQIKDKLKRTLQIQVQFGKHNENDNNSNSPKVLHQSKDVPINKPENKVVINDSITNTPCSIKNASVSRSVPNDVFSPSTSFVSRVPSIFTPKSSKRPNFEDTKTVICPVCKVTISELYINKHLDDCLKREAMKEKPQMGETKRKPLPKLVFTLMRDAELRKKMKEFGLSSQGDRKTLEARLQRYIVVYNAECDKTHPRPILELIKQCEDEEYVEKKISKTSFLNRLQVNRNTETNVIEDERQKYLDTHKESFASLIKHIKSNDSPKKSSARRSLLQENIESNKYVPFKRQAVNLDDSMPNAKQSASKSLNSCVIEDSDSDDSCSLLVYSSTDPMKFLTAELSSYRSNDEQCKSEPNNEENIDEHMLPNCSSTKTFKEEKDCSSDAFSDTSIYDRTTQSVMEESFSKEMLQEEENEKPILQDILCDFSSNDSIDSKLNYGKLRSTSHGVLNSSAINFSSMEKENISSSPECSGSRSFRKRSRDLTQIDNKLPSSRRRKIKKSPDCYTAETKESNNEQSLNTSNDREVEYLQNKPRLRRRVSNTSKDTTLLRKSTRAKTKNNK